MPTTYPLGLSKDARLLFRASLTAEELLKCSGALDPDIAEEVFEKAGNTLGSISDGPNEFKKVGHYAFWVRKLKPFTVEVHPKNTDGEKLPGGFYFNEFVAFIMAADLLGMHGHKIKDDLDFIQDVVATMRYSSCSPSTLTLMFQAMASPK